MKKHLIALCAAGFLAMPAAHAQAPAAAAAPAPAPATAAAPAPVDPAAAAAVRELLEAMKYREMMQASFAQLKTNMPAIMQQGAATAINANASLDAKQKKAALERAGKEIPTAAAALSATFDDPKLLDELIAEIIPLYARHFSAAEIGQIAAFYKTPVGAKTISTMPVVMGESMQIGQKIMIPRINAAIEKITKKTN